MSKLEELLRDLCPEGVAYAPLWSVTIWDKKYASVPKEKQKIVKKYYYFLASELEDLVDKSGSVKILTTSKTDMFTTREKAGPYTVTGEVVAIPWGGNPIVQYYNGEFITADNRIATSYNTEKLNNKFLYYCLLNKLPVISSYYRGSGIKHPNMEKVLGLSIPVPPLPVQAEIVRILDSFTDLSADLLDEAEARKAQYEYYRDALLDFPTTSDFSQYQAKGKVAELLRDLCPEGVERCTLDSQCIIKGRIGFRGYKKSDLVSKGSGAISISPRNILNDRISYEDSSYISWEKYEESPEIMIEPCDIVFTKTASVGKCAIIRELKEKCTINPQMVVLKHIKCNPIYLSYVLQSSKFQLSVKKEVGIGSVPNIPQSKLSKLTLPVPPLPVQAEIVRILDSFTDLSADLSDEAEARKAQYEHYRDELLNFKKLA